MSLAHHSRKQCMLLRGKRIHHGDPAPGESILQILGEQQPASRFSRGRKDDRVPDAQAMVGGDIESGDQNRGRSLNQRKGVLPAKNDSPRLPRRKCGFSYLGSGSLLTKATAVSARRGPFTPSA
jgi:hypothetical protein